MDRQGLQDLLHEVAEGTRSPEEALESLRDWPYENLGFARIDHHRELRRGVREVIYCPGKTAEQIAAIASRLRGSRPVLLTRLAPDFLGPLHEVFGAELTYYAAASLGVLGDLPRPERRGLILVVSAGTADQGVAQEAAIVARALGNPVEEIQDVGVAGLHRLLDVRPSLERARVIIVVAGMEGALPSVVAGLTDRPVIAVPTSAGYGANFGGLSALLAMLNSCASGLGVVNIDNGFGAARLADAINLVAEEDGP